MAKTTSKIYKKGSLDFKDPVKIDRIQIENSNAEIASKSVEISTDAKAIIVENKKDFSIIEVTCNCGKKLYLKCDHNQTKE